MADKQTHGWVPDRPDPQDFTLDNHRLQKLLLQSQVTQRVAETLNLLVEGIAAIKWPFTNQPVVDPTLVNGLRETIKTLSEENDQASLHLIPATLVGLDCKNPQARHSKDPSGTVIEIGDLACQPDCPAQENSLSLLVLATQQEIAQKIKDSYLTLPRAYTKLQLFCGNRVEDQRSLQLNSCTAHAGVALMEYFELRRHTQISNISGYAAYPAAEHEAEDSRFSSRFLYKVSRVMVAREGDAGVSARDTLKAMLLFGLPPERIWPPKGKEIDAQGENFDTEPSAFCYAYAKNYQAIKYLRLDRPSLPSSLSNPGHPAISQAALLAQIKAALIAGFPVMFGFRVYADDLYDLAKDGIIPYPDDNDPPDFRGHAVVATGYDDDQPIPGRSPGALKFKNSWGSAWGEQGYGWLPYDYVLNTTPDNHMTGDWWTLLNAQWAETQQFGMSHSNPALILKDDGSPFQKFFKKNASH